MSSPRAATPDELPSAFGLLFSPLPPEEREHRSRRALELAAAGDVDLGGVFVLPEGGGAGLAGAVLCQPLAGAGGLVWPPVVYPSRCDAREPLEDALMQHACTWLRGRGVRLAQCLLPDAELSLAGPLLRNGFAHVTGLTYLYHDLRLPADWLRPSPRLRFEPYDPARPRDFHTTLLRTYQDTLDCPEVNGVRTVEEVIEGHRAQGHAARWRLARLRESGDPVAVLFLAQMSPEEWDLAYVGVVPEARRLGLGREVLLHALGEARQAGRLTRLTLSVDDRNEPARRLYARLGFLGFDHRQVFLVIWRSCASAG